MLSKSNAMMMEGAKSKVLQVFDEAVSAVLPGVLIKSRVKLIDNGALGIDGVEYPITKRVYMVGFGKAVPGMAYAMEQILGCRLKRGIVSVPRQRCRKAAAPEFGRLSEGTEVQLQELQMLKRSEKIEYLEGGAGNRPDGAALASTERIVELLEGLTERDTLIVLVSGGGSALLTLPKEPLSLEGKNELCLKLQNAGASIAELNRVRKQLSSVKGGGLAKIAHPARLISLVLSDIVRDPIELVASGPTCPLLGDKSGDEAVEILKKYNLYDNLKKDVQALMVNSKESILQEESMMDNGHFKHVTNIIIGNNLVALKAAKEMAKRFDIAGFILSNTVEGNVKEVSYAYAKLTNSVCHILEKDFDSESDFTAYVSNKDITILDVAPEKLSEMYKSLMDVGKGKGVLLILGGEPTVIVEGSGTGGRNQELALRFSLDWFCEISKDPMLANYFVLFLSGGTDGQDGPTDATGALGEPSIRSHIINVRQSLLEKKKATLDPNILSSLEHKLEEIETMLPEKVLKRNDSYTFYSKLLNGSYLVKTGLTGTNVMDLHFVYIQKRSCVCNIQREAFTCNYNHDEPSEDSVFTFNELVERSS